MPEKKRSTLLILNISPSHRKKDKFADFNSFSEVSCVHEGAAPVQNKQRYTGLFFFLG